jgi:hypothetical protein
MKKTAKKKKIAKKVSAKKPKAKKSRVGAGGVLKAANQFRKTTKKMVDDVFLKLVGMRVLERAQQMSASLKEEKARQVDSGKKPAKNKNSVRGRKG